MNHRNRSLRRPGLLFTLIMAVVGATAAPTHAAPLPAPPSCGSYSCGAQHAGPCGASCHSWYLGPYARRHYDRGFTDGDYVGYEYGVEDGLYGRPFCNLLPRLRRNQRYYVTGYREGYLRAYREGYEDGRFLRR